MVFLHTELPEKKELITDIPVEYQTLVVLHEVPIYSSFIWFVISLTRTTMAILVCLVVLPTIKTQLLCQYCLTLCRSRTNSCVIPTKGREAEFLIWGLNSSYLSYNQSIHWQIWFNFLVNSCHLFCSLVTQIFLLLLTLSLSSMFGLS